MMERLLGFRLSGRQLQIADFFSRSAGSGLLTFAFGIAALLCGWFAGEKLLARQAAAKRKYRGEEHRKARSVGEKEHFLTVVYRNVSQLMRSALHLTSQLPLLPTALHPLRHPSRGEQR
ncbi:MAG TPA: hypothetical protein VMZ52_07830 [Bryobacteraceae bacterium]|nr:hypothetical protein [Bryobacteraceae bacterium]